jgi:hypothetical protein
MTPRITPFVTCTELEAERGFESEAVVVDPRLSESAAAVVAAAAAPAAGHGGSSTPAIFACDACARLLLEPSVLPCSHVVCKVCVPSRPSQHAQDAQHAQRCCPVCDAAVPTRPGVCMQLDKLLRAHMPHETAAREAAAAAATAERSSSQGGVGVGGCCAEEPAGAAAVDPEPASHPDQQEDQAAPPPAAAAGDRPDQQTRQGAPPEVVALLASGRPMAEMWPELQREFMRVADERYVWHGVGCDSCGAYPIAGARYRCT